VKILAPIYKDENTKWEEPTHEEPYPGHIYMDAMHFGMGCSCLQLTYQSRNVNHARFLYDQLLAFTGPLSALSACAPIYKGKLSDIDLRWNVIAQSVDCRNENERNSEHEDHIPKSRYSGINHYLSNHKYSKKAFEDTIQYKVDQKLVERMTSQGIDEKLAFHIASLFIRDPMSIFNNRIEINDEEDTDHFENFQSTNWNSLRFKPPPTMNSDIGWRVEFRPLDIQITDFENAAYSALVTLLTAMIAEFDVDFIMPISQIDENMERAHTRNAVLNEKFFFRTNVTRGKDYKKNNLAKTNYLSSNDDDEDFEARVEELTLLEFLTGAPQFDYQGVIPLIQEFMEFKGYEQEEVGKMNDYFTFLTKRASGEILTGASFIRSIVHNHPSYQKDSIVTEEIIIEILRSCTLIAEGKVWNKKLLGDIPKSVQMELGLDEEGELAEELAC
jgi:glutamate--cysteine ligase catalytic subunit